MLLKLMHISSFWGNPCEQNLKFNVFQIATNELGIYLAQNLKEL